MAAEGIEALGSGDVRDSVARRYAAGAREREAELCCPVDYDARHLEVLPGEILERDYGCGDPSRWLRAGETVLDLGSGGGKICYIASQVVGPEGRVIGVDMTPDMLALARRHRRAVGERIGWHNVEFRRGRIEDLRLDLDRLDAWIRAHPARDVDGWAAVEREAERLRREEPMVPDDAVDVVVSNCVLNLVAPASKRRLFAEIFRVLRRGGRAVISDVVADREVPAAMRNDPGLWSGCISGALEEGAFLAAFEDAGFHGMRVLARQEEPWREVDGIAFRPVTVAAYKGKHGPCLDEGHAVVYRGPFRCVEDDDEHRFVRGRRTPVCAKTFSLLGREPYAGCFTRLRPGGDTLREGGAAPACAPPAGGEESCC